MYGGSHSGRPARRDTTLFGPPALQDTTLFGLYATVLSQRTRGDELESPAQNCVSPSSRLETSVGTWKILEGTAKPRSGVLTEEVG
ncbi:hypothetical protein TNCV_4953341 [Trichonephila clavipes]|nr:hypothetical protein TNCV_4953341 [Trichonephila clavipes]